MKNSGDDQIGEAEDSGGKSEWGMKSLIASFPELFSRDGKLFYRQIVLLSDHVNGPLNENTHPFPI